jgi:hypothetical protein
LNKTRVPPHSIILQVQIQLINRLKAKLSDSDINSKVQRRKNLEEFSRTKLIFVLELKNLSIKIIQMTTDERKNR